MLVERGAHVLLHLGDVETDAVLDELAGHPARVVFGNCDDVDRLSSYAAHLGIKVDHPMGVFDADGKNVVFTHGHMPRLVHDVLGDADYLFHGHSHEVRDERVGRTRVINPGALVRASRYTCSLLDTHTDTLELLEVERPPEPEHAQARR